MYDCCLNNSFIPAWFTSSMFYLLLEALYHAMATVALFDFDFQLHVISDANYPAVDKEIVRYPTVR